MPLYSMLKNPEYISNLFDEDMLKMLLVGASRPGWGNDFAISSLTNSLIYRYHKKYFLNTAVCILEDLLKLEANIQDGLGYYTIELLFENLYKNRHHLQPFLPELTDICKIYFKYEIQHMHYHRRVFETLEFLEAEVSRSLAL